MEHVKQRSVSSVKTIIYARSIDAVADLYLHRRYKVGNYFFKEQIDAENILIEMFHSETGSSFLCAYLYTC